MAYRIICLLTGNNRVPQNPVPIDTYFFQDVAQLPIIQGKSEYLPLTRRIHRASVLKRLVALTPEATFARILNRQTRIIGELNQNCAKLSLPKLDTAALSEEIEPFLNDPDQEFPPSVLRSIGRHERLDKEQREQIEGLGWRSVFLLSLFPKELRIVRQDVQYVPAVRHYFREIHATGREAKAELAKGTLRYVTAIARLYIGQGVDFLELVQEGYLGLLIAAERFNERQASHFQHYAANWIRQRIGRYIALNGRLIRVPVHYREEAVQLQRIHDQICENNRGQFDQWRFFQEVGWLTAEEVEVTSAPRIGAIQDQDIGALVDRLDDYYRVLERHRDPAGRRLQPVDHKLLETINDTSALIQKRTGAPPSLFELFVELGWAKPGQETKFLKVMDSYTQHQKEQAVIESERKRLTSILQKAFRRYDTFRLSTREPHSLDRPPQNLPRWERYREARIEDFIVESDSWNTLRHMDIPTKQLLWALSRLNEREREIIELRFGLHGGISLTLEEIGQRFGVTRERIRQIEAKAFRKLNHPIVTNLLKDTWEASIAHDETINGIAERLNSTLNQVLEANELNELDSLTASDAESRRIERLRQQYIQGGRRRVPRTDNYSRPQMFRNLLEEVGEPTYYGELHERAMKLAPNAITFSKNATYATLFYHKFFRSFGNGTFGLAEWEETANNGHGATLQYCPQPLLPVNPYPNAFLDSILVGRDILQTNRLTAREFWSEMLLWAQRDNNSAVDPQAAFDLWYAAGLVDHIHFGKHSAKMLTLTLSPDLKLQEVRRTCIETLCRRMQKMTELLLTITRIPQPTIERIQRVVFGDPRLGFDITNRLLVLNALDAVQTVADVWEITDLGRAALKACPPQELPDFGEMEGYSEAENEQDEDDWEADLDLVDL